MNESSNDIETLLTRLTLAFREASVVSNVNPYVNPYVFCVSEGGSAHHFQILLSPP